MSTHAFAPLHHPDGTPVRWSDLFSLPSVELAQEPSSPPQGGGSCGGAPRVPPRPTPALGAPTLDEDGRDADGRRDRWHGDTHEGFEEETG